MPVIIWNNCGYGEIAYDMDRKKIKRIGVDLATPDFQALAKGFGCHFGKPESFDAFRELLIGALTARAPTIIELKAAASFLS
jgi:acetolactate synthase I/II/III large subunit